MPTDSTPLGLGDLYQLALTLADPLGLRWRVIPMGGDKRPLVRWREYQERAPSGREVARWFDRFHARVRGLAVILGPVSDPTGRGSLAVRDFDSVDGYRAWARANRDVARRLPTVGTARGAHVYCRLRGWAGYRALPPGDLRATRRRYAMVAGSWHPAGRRYSWLWGEPYSAEDIPLLDIAETGFSPHPEADPDPKSQTPPGPDGGLARHPSGIPLLNVTPPLLRGDYTAVLPPDVRLAVLRSQPRQPGERNRCLMKLARALAGLNADRDPMAWHAAVLAWWRIARPRIGTKEWGVSWDEFRAIWRDVDRTTADTLPWRLAAESRGEAGTGRERIKALAVRLAAMTGGRPFAMSTRMAAAAAGVSQQCATRLIAALVKAGFLVVVVRGKKCPRTLRASTYRLGDGCCSPAPHPPTNSTPG